MVSKISNREKSQSRQLKNLKSLPKFKFASVNVCTAEKDNILQNYINQFSIQELDIVCLQEMHRINSGSADVTSQIKELDYNVYWSCTGPVKRFSGGRDLHQKVQKQ